MPTPTDATPAEGRTRAGSPRLDAIDALRGLVIVLMVLDHVRDFFHADAFRFDPTDLDKTTPALFLTRWITHLCAPTFVFLAGVSIHLQRAAVRPGLSRHLATRGLWLIALELTVISFGFNFAMPFVMLQVIWAIGIGMLAMAVLVHVPVRVVLGLGLAIVALQGLVPAPPADMPTWARFAWSLLMRPGGIPGTPGLIAYPALTWFGILCLGYGLGGVFLHSPAARRRALLVLAAAALASFAVLRATTAFGDPSPWVPRADVVGSALAFIDVSKYPPSLLYVLLTLGVAMLLLVALEHLRGPLLRVLLAFGRTPLFTYLLHIYVAHGLAVLVAWATGTPPSVLVNLLVDPSRAVAAGWGYELGVTYLATFVVLALLAPLAFWFADVKRRRRDAWLGYL
ncbi:DUF1624 domain-containing protein [Dokdonella sp. MW10]|uniref:DUF1624 domain-containing protein n=1 Tax=Dokdonella sp. MW10 TaxID=2992926 RepID=UPI003F7CDFD0